MATVANRFLVVCSCLLTAVLAFGPTHAAEPPAATAARAVWLAIDETFNARDAGRFSQLFAEDASFVRVKRKETLEGRIAIHEEFARRFPGFSPDVRHHTTIGQVTVIAPGVVTADGKVEILRVTPDAGADPAVLQTYTIFVVMTRQPEGLQIRMLRIYELPKEDEAGG